MGYMTTVTFLNDAADQIKRHPELVAEIVLQAMNNTHQPAITYGIGNHANPIEAMRSHHADDPKLYLSYGNLTAEIGAWKGDNGISNLKLRREMLERAKRLIKEEELFLKREALRQSHEELKGLES